MNNSVEVYGIRETLAEIRQVDKELFFKIRAYMKRTGDTLGNAVVSSAPTMAPISGFRHSGRTKWVKPTFKTIVSGRNARKGATGATPLLSVKFLGAGFNIADMAGRGGSRTRRPVTTTYDWQGGKRTHRVTTQGQAMIAALGASPSRYIWSRAETLVPVIQADVLKGVEAYMDEVNRKFEVIGDK